MPWGDIVFYKSYSFSKIVELVKFRVSLLLGPMNYCSNDTFSSHNSEMKRVT